MIGLTIIVIGTSFPELATSVVASVKREPDVAFGNAIGSNVLNLLLKADTSFVNFTGHIMC